MSCGVWRRASGRFKLHSAIQEGDIECLAEFARTSSAEGVNEYDDEGQTPLHIAADAGLPEAVSVLSSAGADVNVQREEDSRTPLHLACNEGHTEVIQALLDNGAIVTAEDFDGWQPLHVACYYGSAEIADLLLRNGAKVEARTSKGQTPLHIATEMAESKWLNRGHDYALTMKLLIASGAQVDALDVYGQTPLHTSTKNVDLPSMRLLLEHGADVAAAPPAGQPHGGLAPLHIAVQKGSQDAAELLLAHKADVNGCDANGLTPLHIAVDANSPAMVTWLLAHGANPRTAMASGWTPIHYAIRLGHESCVLALLQACPSLVDEADENGLSPLCTAAETGDTEVASTLLDKGADVRWSEPTRRITALHVAAYHDQVDFLKFLLEKDVDVNAQDANGHTSLHVASLLNKGHLISLLLQAGADVSVLDNKSKTAEQLAVDKNSDEVLRQFAVMKL